MRILIVHNAYGKYSGEEAVVESIKRVLEKHHHEVRVFQRLSEEILNSFLGKAKGFIAGIYSRSGVLGLRKALHEFKPDVVNVHNLFPLISPAALFECKKVGVPVIMTVHNYRLICPTGLFMRQKQPCELCLEKGHEWNCIRYNCENSWGKSVGYAFRNYVARKSKAFMECVDIFSCITEFQRTKLIAAGFPKEKIYVNPNFYDIVSTQIPTYGQGEYVGYCGRLSEEKGLDLIFQAASDYPNIPFRFAGTGNTSELLRKAPNNCSFLGHLSGNDLNQFIRHARFMVLASKCYEGFPMAILEAAANGKTCIAPNHGGFCEIIGQGSTAIGKLFEPGNAKELSSMIDTLWHESEMNVQLAQMAYNKVAHEYSSNQYYNRFTEIYSQALKLRQKSGH